MEAVIYHFKHYTEGFHPPRGGLRAHGVGPGGTRLLHRLRRRLHALPGQGAGAELRQPAKPPLRLQGEQVPDMVAIIASLDPVMGDVDR